MYIDNDDFYKWMEKLSKKLTDIGQDLKSMNNTQNSFEKDEKILDNQDWAFLLKVSFRTLQRYRSKGKLPHFMIGNKAYYRVSDIKQFIQEKCDCNTYKKFEKENQFDEKSDAK